MVRLVPVVDAKGNDLMFNGDLGLWVEEDMEGFIKGCAEQGWQRQANHDRKLVNSPRGAIG